MLHTEIQNPMLSIPGYLLEVDAFLIEMMMLVMIGLLICHLAMTSLIDSSILDAKL